MAEGISNPLMEEIYETAKKQEQPAEKFPELVVVVL